MSGSDAKLPAFPESQREKNLFELLGGRPTLEKVHAIFYTKIYAHPWLKGFFKDIDKKFIEKQQTDYQTMRMGAGDVYSGKTPATCHRHLFVNDELFELRMTLLKDSMGACDIPAHLANRWLDLVRSSRNEIVKTDPNQCQKRYPTDEIMVIPKPAK